MTGYGTLRPTVSHRIDSSSAVGQTSMENLFERILLFIVVLQVIQTIYKRLLGTRGRQATEPSVQDDTNFNPIFVDEITDRAQRGQRVLASLAQLEINLTTLATSSAIDNPRLLTHMARVRLLTQQAVQTKDMSPMHFGRSLVLRLTVTTRFTVHSTS